MVFNPQCEAEELDLLHSWAWVGTVLSVALASLLSTLASCPHSDISKTLSFINLFKAFYFCPLIQLAICQHHSFLHQCTSETSITASHNHYLQAGDNIPPGYEAVPLIEALNGPSAAPQQPTAPTPHDRYLQLPQNATDAPAEALPRTDASRYFMPSSLLFSVIHALCM